MHNGWKFVSEPHIVYLEPEYEGGKSGKKSPASQSSLRGTFQANSLTPISCPGQSLQTEPIFNSLKTLLS